MPLGDFAEAGTIPKPLPIGRLGRLIFGAGTLFFSVFLIINRSDFTGSSVPEFYAWVGVFFALFYLPDLVVVGFSRQWGRWPQAAALLVALGLLVANFAAYGDGWAPPLGWGLLVFTAFFFAFIGISFVLAAIFAVPG